MEKEKKGEKTVSLAEGQYFVITSGCGNADV